MNAFTNLHINSSFDSVISFDFFSSLIIIDPSFYIVQSQRFCKLITDYYKKKKHST